MRILYIEPFEGGSHAAFGAALRAGLGEDVRWTWLTLPARHWKWRMRGAAAHFATTHAEALSRPHDLLLASSYLALAELIGLVPALGAIPRVLYFHENQLAFPVRDAHTGERDTHFGFTQLVSSLAATRCLFNSAHNRDSFLREGAALLQRLPDAVPPGWIDDIAARSAVLGLPLELPDTRAVAFGERPVRTRAEGPLIVWNHRWEHDKGPATFFEALFELEARGVPFRLAVCGQRFRRWPEVFDQARARLDAQIEHWGPLSRSNYLDLLGRAEIAVSTAQHEFFGISMLEATHLGARPLVPDRLAYPELFPKRYRYPDGALADELERLCMGWLRGDPATTLRADRRTITSPHASSQMCPRYRDVFERLAGAPA